MTETAPRFKQFVSEGAYSYALHDSATREGVLISPRLDLLAEYRAYLHENGIKLRAALELGFQAHLFSATPELCRELGCTDGTGRDRAEFGTRALTRLTLPGASAAACAWQGSGYVFTGETLLIGTVGLCDAKQNGTAEAFYESLRKLAALPSETLVYPARDGQDRLFTTIGTELACNPLFAQAARGNREAVLAHFRERAAGGAGVADGQATQAVTAITVDKYGQKLRAGDAGTLFLDVREPDEFSAGHMPGARNLPLSELGFHLSELKAAKRIYFSCLSGRRSLRAARTLAYLGAPDAVNVTGGYQSWCASGMPVEA